MAIPLGWSVGGAALEMCLTCVSLGTSGTRYIAMGLVNITGLGVHTVCHCQRGEHFPGYLTMVYVYAKYWPLHWNDGMNSKYHG